jgi:hypothetical protein
VCNLDLAATLEHPVEGPPSVTKGNQWQSQSQNKKDKTALVLPFVFIREWQRADRALDGADRRPVRGGLCHGRWRRGRLCLSNAKAAP